MQESRLFKIVYHLLDKGQATASELAEKFEVSVRTIYRDVDALSAAGIPIYVQTGRNGGIHLMQDFVLNKAVLSEKEKQEILTALQSISVTGNVFGNQTLEKLSALFKVSSENWFEVDFSRWGDRGQQDNRKFELLKSAVICHKCVKITYAGSYKAVCERKIQPLKLLYKSNHWYLKAFCMKKQDYRIFKLNRILDLEILEETFVPTPFPKEADVPLQECKEIVLLFPKEMAHRVYDEFEAEVVNIQENGDLMVSVHMPEDEWLVGFLLSFGTQVEVVEPSYLKDILAQRAKEIYEKNKT